MAESWRAIRLLGCAMTKPYSTDLRVRVAMTARISSAWSSRGERHRGLLSCCSLVHRFNRGTAGPDAGRDCGSDAQTADTRKPHGIVSASGASRHHAVDTNMIRLFGRAPRGERVIGRVPFSAWQTVTFVAALRHGGMTAPMMIKGAMNGDAFLAYVDQCLVPTLKRGDIVKKSPSRCRTGANGRSSRPPAMDTRAGLA
jgi:hypothetical protein